MENTFYVTTPIYYPNDIPHVGHAYTTIVADVLSRWNKINNKNVFFLTGTDEHGMKIQRTAEEKNKKPKEFIDELIPKFKDAWRKLDIDYNRFIRTTDKDHEAVVKEILQKVYNKGDIYKGEYEGLYCTGCEAYYTEKDLENGCCPIHQKKVEKLKEETYFFKLSKYKDKLIEFYNKNPEFILPKWRKKEIINRLNNGLNDLSISRTSFNWGIPLPFDKKHVCYVWFDALLNYYTATRNGNEEFWPTDLHIVAKDIMWFHVVIWPAILMSAEIDLPKSVFVHGYWTFDNEKISKSRGKVININELISIAGVDSARYFLLRETPFGHDGDFSEKALIDRHNGELVNKLGNLVSRVAGLIEKNGVEKTQNNLIKKINEKRIGNLIDNYEFDKALNEIFAFIDTCNEYVQEKKPWKTKDKKVLFELKESILKISELLSPFIPDSAEKIKKQFSAKDIKKSDYLFKRIEEN
ncbi:MAG: methionine--tRNA ligase [Nanoarchaeota archaeon]